MAITEGELRFASAETTTRLVWVGATNTEGWVRIALVHTYPEMATSADHLVSAPAAGVPYPLVIQSDLQGVLWASQLGPPVGQIDRDEVLTCPVGLRLLGPSDRRWGFKRQEGADLSALVANCTSTLLASYI